MNGVLVTTREPPKLFSVAKDEPQNEKPHIAYAVGGDPSRDVFWQERSIRPQKRYHAILKQVAGGVFAGASHERQEDIFVEAFVALSQEADAAETTQSAVARLLPLLGEMLSNRVDETLRDFTARLADPKVVIRWDGRAASCQAFCRRLVDETRYGPLSGLPVGRKEERRDSPMASPPLQPQHHHQQYLFSFVSGPIERREATKPTDAANGHMEDYLLQTRWGQNTESDFVDTLQEYWHDWGAFVDGAPYKYQELFPWDCSEAYCAYPTKCGRCSVAKHIWAFPWDAWSLVEMHLARHR